MSALLLLTVIGLGCRAAAAQAKTTPSYWIAGTYDSTHVVVVFTAVHYGLKEPPGAQELPPAMASWSQGLGSFFRLPAAVATDMEARAGGEQFRLGNHYDLMVGNAGGGYRRRDITLTDYVGWQFDEGEGNDSYLGALAHLAPEEYLTGLSSDTYVVERHPPGEHLPDNDLGKGEIVPGSLSLAQQSALADVLNQELPEELILDGPTETALREGRGQLRFETTVVRLTSGELRYFVRAEWDLPLDVSRANAPALTVGFALSAWISPTPKLRVMSATPWEGVYNAGIDENGVYQLLNAVQLDASHTGVLVLRPYSDGFSVALYEYADGGNMRVLNSFSAGE